MLIASCLAAGMWLALLLTPWRPWSTRERLLPLQSGADTDFGDLTALIPARDEAATIAATVGALDAQGHLGRIIVIDDQSADGTGDIARGLGLDNLTVIEGSTPPPGWSGKLWALEQGYREAHTPWLLLIDADIELAPGTLAALRARQRDDDLALASVMARLHMAGAWEKLLLPPFIYFFKLIYPFALSNNPRSRVAAAAGGCILVEKARLDALGGFSALHDAIIDDCTLAARIKRGGGRTWLGLSHAVRAIRPYASLAGIWDMVARTAYTQLRYSPLLLALCTVLLLLSFVVPLAALTGIGGGDAQAAGLVALTVMGLTYLPTVRYYDLAPPWVATLPLAACLFLAMTWTSAWRYWSGERSRWKNRSYARTSSGLPGDDGT